MGTDNRTENHAVLRVQASPSPGKYVRGLRQVAVVIHPGVGESGITRGLPAMIPIAMLYSTPEDAAAEIAYIEARGYPISYVEMGEEADGHYTGESIKIVSAPSLSKHRFTVRPKARVL
jgi:hypothetical protein